MQIVMDIDMEKRSLLLRDFQNGLTRFQANANLKEKFGDCVGYGVRTCERWFNKFKKGDFDLTVKPRDKCYKDRTYSKRKRPTKAIKKVDEVTFKQQQQLETTTELQPEAAKSNEQSANVESLLTKKRELTVSKVSAKSGAAVKKPSTEPNIVTRRLVKTSLPKLIPVNDSPTAVPAEMPKLRPRRPRSQGIEIKLPDSAAKRMSPQTLTENHNIGGGNRSSNKSETIKNTPTKGSKAVTVQFQNLSPEIAKNTVCTKSKVQNRTPKNSVNKNPKVDNNGQVVKPSLLKSQNPITKRLPPTNGISTNPKVTNNRQVDKSRLLKSQTRITPQGFANTDGMLKITNVAHIDSMSPEKRKEQTTPDKRCTPPQQTPLSPLNNPTGVIYLNPQEIFRSSFGGFGSLPSKRQLPSEKYYKNPKRVSLQPTPLPPAPMTMPTPPPEDSVVLSDSDGDDLVFPENTALPAPKIKTDTFTTYWDLESGKPIPINGEVEPVLPKATVPSIIEID
ncbi:proteoglycan 4-like [Episyrphus balteatus]|uniref:proteoglycan 4-like n=1 Tax=Episyrphus balteatus TaxID=286459 RepID=UPI0024852618|nr:proteoglycan 4-like [Episyrphus balteatus]